MPKQDRVEEESKITEPAGEPSADPECGIDALGWSVGDGVSERRVRPRQA